MDCRSAKPDYAIIFMFALVNKVAIWHRDTMLSSTQKKLRNQTFFPLPHIAGKNKLQELINSLSSIWDLSRLAKRELASNHAAKQCLDKMVLMTEHAFHLAQELNLETYPADNNSQHLDLNKILRQSLASVDTLLLHDIELNLSLDAYLPAINGRPSALKQLFDALITNAAEAIQPRSGKIQIESGTILFNPDLPQFESAKGDWLIPGFQAFITITDSGSGMAPGTLARAFEPFFTTKPLGEGLGLPKCLEIINQHKGGISVSSQLAQGTAVTLYLPAVQSLN